MGGFQFYANNKTEVADQVVSWQTVKNSFSWVYYIIFTKQLWSSEELHDAAVSVLPHPAPFLFTYLWD